jgi:hypothetical protein
MVIGNYFNRSSGHPAIPAGTPDFSIKKSGPSLFSLEPGNASDLSFERPLPSFLSKCQDIKPDPNILN